MCTNISTDFNKNFIHTFGVKEHKGNQDQSLIDHCVKEVRSVIVVEVVLASSDLVRVVQLNINYKEYVLFSCWILIV